MSDPVVKTEEEWCETLTTEQYSVLRDGATEPAFSGEYWNCDRPGTYHCAGCGQPLFTAADKVPAGTGWPSFSQPINDAAVRAQPDVSHGMARTEVRCARCGGHLGHLFEGDPEPGRLRYSINSVALQLVEK